MDLNYSIIKAGIVKINLGSVRINNNIYTGILYTGPVMGTLDAI